jgi:predicted secreted protein
MGSRFRVLAGALILILALWGCQKGSEKAASATPDMAEAKKADAQHEKATHTAQKSGSKTSKTSKAHEERTAEARKPKPAEHEAHRAGTLTEADNGMEYDFHQGQVITVLLDSNRSTGLSWSLVEPAGSVIVPEGKGSYAASSGKSQRGTETWRFRAAKPGYQTIKMEYRRKWASSVPERTFRFSGKVK